MRFPLALLTIGALLTGQLDSNPLTTDGNTNGEMVIAVQVEECANELEKLDVFKACKSQVETAHPFTELPLDQLVNRSAVEDHRGVCDELIEMAVCVNERACANCTDNEEVLQFGANWYDKHLERAREIGCANIPQNKCQDALEHNKENVPDDDDDEDIEWTGLSATSITIIVVIVLTLILVGIMLYCIIFGSSGEAEDVDEGKSAKEGPSKGAKSASAPKSTKDGEPSTKSKLPSVAKSTVKSAIAAGAKSKIKSAVAETKVSSKVKSTVSTGAKSKVKSSVAETKAASKVASKSKV